MTENWTRRQFLQRTSLAALASLLPLPELQRPWTATPDILAMRAIKLGDPIGPEAEDLGNGYSKLTYPSGNPLRPHLEIAKDGEIQFKRTYVKHAGAWWPAGTAAVHFAQPEAKISAPSFYRSVIPPVETYFDSYGFAKVVTKATPSARELNMYETLEFMRMPLRQFERFWQEGDLAKTRTALITVDGTGSDPRSQSFKAYEDLYDNYDRVEHLTHSDYSLRHTIQDLFRMSEVIRDKVEELKRAGINSIDFLTYSLGSVVTWLYLIREVAAPSGSHRDGTIRSFVSLAGPIGGVEDEARFSYGLSYMFGNTLLLGNETTNLLTFWGSSEDRRRENENYARTLRERGVRQMFGHNEDDCFTTTPFTTISGNSQVISMGRGENGIPDCDSIFLVPILPGNRIENIGHNQVLDDPRMVSNVTYFLTA